MIVCAVTGPTPGSSSSSLGRRRRQAQSRPERAGGPELRAGGARARRAGAAAGRRPARNRHLDAVDERGREVQAGEICLPGRAAGTRDGIRDTRALAKSKEARTPDRPDHVDDQDRLCGRLRHIGHWLERRDDLRGPSSTHLREPLACDNQQRDEAADERERHRP